MPDLPTIAETIPGFDSFAFNYLAGPAGLPEGGGRTAEPRRPTGSWPMPASSSGLTELGLEPIGGTPAETVATIREEAGRAREVILAANIRAE